MSWIYGMLVAITTTAIFPVNDAANTANQETELKQGIRVEVVGVLRFRFTVDSKNIRSSRVYTSDGMLDLDLTAEQKKTWGKLANRKVRVRGKLLGRDQKSRLRWKVMVDSMEAIGPEVPWPKIRETFTKITIDQSGGIAGVMERRIVTADGKVVMKSLDDDKVLLERQLDHEILMQLHELVGKTGWQHMPKEFTDPRTIADGMDLVFKIESANGEFTFEIDSPGGDSRFQPLFDLMRLANGEEPFSR